MFRSSFSARRLALGSGVAALVCLIACGGSTAPVSTVPVITMPFGDQLVYQAKSAKIYAQATSYPLPTFTWERSNDSGTTWIPLTTGISSDSQGSSYTFTPVPGDTGAMIRLTASNALGSAVNDPATITVRTLPVFSTQPASQTIQYGHAVSFTVAASALPVNDPDNDFPAPTFSWQKSPDGVTWTTITGATGATYSIAAVAFTQDAYRYRAVATNSAGSTNSSSAKLTVTP